MKPKNKNILSLLETEPSTQSVDFVTNKKQFHLHTLLTEQRHSLTWNLSSTIQNDMKKGLSQIFSVDKDIVQKFRETARDTACLGRAAKAIKQAVRKGNKIYIYGCGATGRLAKQIESAIWRPFWRKVKRSGLWYRLRSHLPDDIEERLIGEMTGGDRALISALEGLEDLELVGKLQLLDRGIKKGDVVFCITEGGETSSVIGTIKAALIPYAPLNKESIEEASHHLYFIYNNPDNVLKPLDRSCSVIENPAISRINLTTGPQAIAGSTRMQAATSETYLMGVLLEVGIYDLLQEYLTGAELSQLGFVREFTIKKRLSAFESLLRQITDSIDSIARLTEIETETYREGKRAIYFAEKALLPVFIDCAERSPTFHLFPLDTNLETERKSWLQVWTEAENSQKAWQIFLKRNFRGLEERLYKPYFEAEIKDPYLKRAALESLAQAGTKQERLYDFSFSWKNIKERGPEIGDLGILACVDEETEKLADPKSAWTQFTGIFQEAGAKVAVISTGKTSCPKAQYAFKHMLQESKLDTVLHFPLPGDDDPLQLKRQVLLKIILNGHSTGVMARLGRVVGNTMTNVRPSNLKLIGRATALIVSHVNDTMSQAEWEKEAGPTPPVSYAQANAVLFEALDFNYGKGSQMSEVELSIFRILETLRTCSPISWEETQDQLQRESLENYLKRVNPALRR